MHQAAAQMMAVAVKLHSQPEPTVRTGALYKQFLAYRRVGQWITTGKW